MVDSTSTADSSDQAALAAVRFSNGGMFIPPLHRDYMITVNAHVAGVSHASQDDNPTAYMRLFLNGDEVEYRFAEHFQNSSGYDFNVDHSFLHIAGTTAQFQLEHNNDRADETIYGMMLKAANPF